MVTLLASQHRSVSDPPGAGCCAIADAYHTAVALWARSGRRMDAGEGFCTSSLGRCYDSVVMLLHQGQRRLPCLDGKSLLVLSPRLLVDKKEGHISSPLPLRRLPQKPL